MLFRSKHDLHKDAQGYADKASIQDCNVVASYNWLDKGSPTLLVPGQYIAILWKDPQQEY